MIDNIVAYKLVISLLMTVIIIISYLFSRAHRNFLKFLIFFSITSTLIYLLWRTFYTVPKLNILSLILGTILLTAEWIGFFQSCVYKWLFWSNKKVEYIPIEKFEKLPTVDIFIVTYNESLDILRKTVSACKKIDYPENLFNVYVCDDGRRAEVKELCDEYKAHYIGRNDNKYAKAGNVNNALSQTKGEFILLLDADMIPKRNILKRTLGQFIDKSVAFVQTPQVFYNYDPFQYNLYFENSIPNEQDFFMRDIESGRSVHNAVLHVGTNAVFRRSSLDAIGGIPTGTITEDMATGMLLQAKGFKTIFINEVLAIGLSAETFSDLIKQRDRWCRGNIQVAKKWNPLTVKGLNLKQRIIYFDGVIYWFFGVQKMIHILAPLIYLIFGIILLNARVIDLLLFFVPYFLSSVLFFRSAVGKRRNITWSNIYEIAMSPYIALSALSELVFGNGIKFNVTPKGRTRGKPEFLWKLAMPHIILFLATIYALVITAYKFYTGNIHLIDAYIINISWAIYNGLGLLMAIFICLERPKFRNSERFNVGLFGKIAVSKSASEEVACTVEDISENGAKIKLQGKNTDQLKTGDVINVYVDRVGEIKARICWISKDRSILGVNFFDLSNDQYDELIQMMFEDESKFDFNYKRRLGVFSSIFMAVKDLLKYYA